MEEVKFWTKGKLIALAIFIGIIAIIFGAISLHKYSVKKQYVELENQFTYAAPNYLLKEQIKLKKGQWRKIDIKDILKQKLVINDLAKNCKGYVTAVADKSINTIDYNTYLDCGSYKSTKQGVKLAAKNQNKSKTQSQKDTKKPTIKLLGKATVTVEMGTKYKEKGAVATDNVDGDITDKIKITGTVDTSTIGEYIITYTVSDKAGNKASIKRTVVVTEQAEKEEKDITKPEITFTSNTVQTICAGTKIDTSQNGVYGYVAYDDTDGDITKNVKISGDTGVINSPGTYKLEYSVSDKAKNKGTASREFIVKDCSSKPTTVTTPSQPDPTPQPSNPNPTPQPSNPQPSTPSQPSTPIVTVPVRGIIVTPRSASIGVGGGVHITATPSNSNASDHSFNFSSSNSGIASVDGAGNVVGHSRGSVTITVRSNSTPSQATVVNITVN